MNLISNLSDTDLLLKIKALVGEEKKITQEVLSHLEEIEYRKLYLAKGYPSLFDYCVKELGYSQGSTNRRISAMRLIKTISEAKEKLSHGTVNLSTLTQLHGFLKREEKQKLYTPDMKLELLNKIEGKSQDQCEREFVKISPLSASLIDKKKPLTEDLTQITFVASKRLKLKLDQIRNLIAHKNSNPSMAELIEMISDLALKKLDPIDWAGEREGGGEIHSAAANQCVKDTSNASRAKGSRYIAVKIKRQIWMRSRMLPIYRH